MSHPDYFNHAGHADHTPALDDNFRAQRCAIAPLLAPTDLLQDLRRDLRAAEASRDEYRSISVDLAIENRQLRAKLDRIIAAAKEEGRTESGIVRRAVESSILLDTIMTAVGTPIDLGPAPATAHLEAQAVS